MNFNYWIYLFPILLLVKASSPVDQINFVNTYEQILNDDKYLDDFIFPPEQSCFDPDDDFTQPLIFDVATPIKSNKRTSHYASPLVADVTGDGTPEILVASSDNIVVSRNGYLSVTTRNILVYKYNGTAINLIGTIETPQFNLEGLTPFVVGKINATDPYPTILLATSQNQAANPLAPAEAAIDLNNASSSRIIAYRFSGAPGVFNEIGRSNIKYGDNVPFVELTSGDVVQFREGATPGMADFNQDGIAELYIYDEIYDLSNLPNITRRGIGPGNCPGGVPCGIGMIGHSHFQTRPDFETNPALETPYSLIESNGGTMALTVAADVVGDNRLELLAGNTVYRINTGGANWALNPVMAPAINGQTPRDGFTGVASILGTSPDGAGPNNRLDIIVTTANEFGGDNRMVYVWNPDGSEAHTTVSLNRPNGEIPIPSQPAIKRPVDNLRIRVTGAPFVGNIQGDRTPEIGFTVTYGLWMLEYDRASNQLIPLNSFADNGMLRTTDESGYTKLTMFDFDQDLIQEIVYRDEDFLRILGPDGTNKVPQIPAKSNTAAEGAIVADLDRNGQAEIVYTEWDDNQFGRPEYYSPSRLTVLKSGGAPWAPSRSVWNQYGYFNVNVGGDLSIPRQQLNHAGYAQDIFPEFPKDNPAGHCVDPYDQPLNNFLVQATFFSAEGCPTSLPVFDLIVVDAFANRVCDPGQLSTVFTIRNGSALVDVPNETNFSFYFNGQNTPFAERTLGELLDDPEFELSFEEGEVQVIYIFDGLTIPPGDVEIIILGNYKGNITYAGGSAVFNPDNFEFVECNYDNNTTQDPVQILNTPEFTITNSDPFYCEGEDLDPAVPLITLTPNEEFTDVIAEDDLADFFEQIGLEIRWEYGIGEDPASVATWIPIGPGVAEFEVGPTGLTLTANGLAPGIYQIRAVRDCEGVSYINTQIEVFAVPAGIEFVPFDISCHDLENGSIEPSSSTIPNFELRYELYLNGTLLETNETGEFFDLTDGVYEIKYYNKRAFEFDPQIVCVGEGSATINRPSEVTSAFTVSPTTCELPNGSVIISAEGGVGDYRVEINYPDGSNVSLPFDEDLLSIEFSDLPPGNYNYTVFDGNNCPSPGGFEISQSDLPDFAISDDSILEICEGDISVIIAEMTDTGIPPAVPNYELYFDEALTQPVSASTDLTYSNNGAGRFEVGGLIGRDEDYQFWVGISGENTCNAPPLPVSVTVHPLPEAFFEGQDALCHDGLGAVLVTGGTADFLYTITGPESHAGLTQTELESLELIQGTYSVTIIDTSTDLDCEGPGFGFEIGSPDPVTTTYEVTDTNCELPNGAVVISAEGGVGNYRVEIAGPEGFTRAEIFATGETSIEFTDLAPGDYTYTVFDGNDCPIDEGFTVAPSDGPEFAISDESVLEICEGEVSVIIAEMTDAGVPPAEPIYDLYFDEALTQPVSASTDLTFSNNGAGRFEVGGLEGRDELYSFWVGISGENTCGRPPLPVSVKVYPLPEAIFDGQDALCHDGLGAVLITGGTGLYLYNISGPESHTGLTQTELESLELLQGTYAVTIVDTSSPLDCEGPGFGFEIGSPDPVTTFHEVTDTNCELPNGAVVISAEGGVGNYRVEISGPEGFAGAEIFATGGTTIEFTDLAPGDYTYTVFDGNDCPIEEGFTVAPSEGPEFAISDESVLEICEGEISVIIAEMTDAGVPPAEPIYDLYFDEALTQPVSASTDLTYSNNGAGRFEVGGLEGRDELYSFWVGISGDNTCNVPPLPVEVKVNFLPEAELIAEPLLCHDDDFILNINNGSPDYRYRFPNGEFPGDFTEEQLMDKALAGDFSGNTDYTIEIFVETTGCFITNLINFEQPSPITFNEEALVDATCELDNGLISLSFSGGTPSGGGFYRVNLQGPDGYDENLNESNADGAYIFGELAPGTYTWFVFDANECQLSGDITIEDTPGIPVDLTLEDVEVCAQEGEVALLTPQVPADQAPVLTYVWTLDGTVITDGFTNSEGFVHNLLADGVLQVSNMDVGSSLTLVYDLEVSGTDLCTVSDQVSLLVYPEITFDVDYTAEICLEEDRVDITVIDLKGGKDDNYTLTLEGTDYTGNAVNISQAALVFEDIAAGEYTVTVSGDVGCVSVVEPIIISLPDSPVSIIENVQRANCGEDNGILTLESISGGFGPDFIWEFYEEGMDPDEDSPLASDTWNNNPVTFENLAEGEYFIRVFDRNNCPTDFPVLIEMAPDPVFAIQDPIVLCEGDSNGTFIINADNSEMDADNLAVTWYYINTTGDRVELTDNSSIGNATYTLLGEGTNNPALQVEGLQPGFYTYELEVGCTSQILSTSIQIDPLPQASLDLQDVLCYEDDFILNINNGSPAYRYDVVSGPGGFTPMTGLTEEALIDAAVSFEQGDYSFEIYYEGARDCFIAETVSFTKPDLLEVDVDIEEASCGQPDGSIRITVSGGTQRADNTYQVALFVDGDPSGIDPVISAGGTVYLFEELLPNENYSWTITDQNGCFVEGTGEVPNNEGIEISVSVDPVEVCADDTAIILPNIDADGNPFTVTWYKDAARTQTVSNGVGSDGLTYEVNPSTGELSISGFDTDEEIVLNYYMRVFGDNICTPPLQELVLTVVPEIDIVLDYNGEICLPDQETLITVNAEGGRGDFEYSIDGGNTWQTDNTFTVVGEGVYDILVQSAFGCESAEQAIIALAEDPINVDFAVTPTSCGEDIGSIEITGITGGFGDYTWVWQDGDGNELAVEGMSLTGIPEGTYVLLIEDKAGCDPVAFTIEVGTAPEPEFSEIEDIIICEEDIDPDNGIVVSSQNTISEASNLAVRWYKGPGLAQEIAEGNDPALPGVSYVFDNSDPQNPSLGIFGLEPGIYEFTMLSECTLQEIPFTIEVKEAPDPEFDVQPIACFGDSDGKIIPIDPNADWEFYVDNSGPMSAEDLADMEFAEGTYVIMVVSANGCDWSDEITIEAPPAAISVSPVSTINPSCGEDIGRIVINVQGGWPNYTVQLFGDPERTDLIEEKTNVSPGNVTFTGLGAGSFYFTVIDEEDCIFLWESETALEDGPTQIQVEDQDICEGADVLLEPEIFQTNADPVFVWYFDAALSDEVSNGLERDGAIYNLDARGDLSIVGLTADINLFVTVTGSGTCEGYVEEVAISVLPAVSFDLEKEEEQCPGDGGVIRVLNVQGGDGDYEYSLDGSTWQISNEFTDLPSGDYEVFVRSANCLSMEEIALEPADGVEVLLISTVDASCEDNNGIIIFEVSGGFLEDGEQYEIEFFELIGGELIPSALGDMVDMGGGEYSYENLPEGDYAIRVSDSNACFFILSPIEIRTQTEPGETYDRSFEFCESPFFDLSVEDALTDLIPNVTSLPIISWTKDGTDVDPTSALETGVYQVTQIRDADGCPVEDITLITVTSTLPPAPEQREVALVFCIGDQLVLSDLELSLEDGFDTLEWFDENGNSIDPDGFVISGAGTYTSIQTKAPLGTQDCPESRETTFTITRDDPVEIRDAVNYTYCQFDVVALNTLEDRLIAEGLLDAGIEVVWEDEDGNVIPGNTEANLNRTYLAIQEDESGNCLVRKMIAVSFTVDQPSVNQLPPRSYEICVDDELTLADLIADQTDLQSGWDWFDADGNPVSMNTLLVVGTTYQVVMGDPDAENCDVVDIMNVNILEGECGDPNFEPLPVLVLEDRIICEGDELIFRPLIQNRRGRQLSVMYYLDENATVRIDTRAEWQIEYRANGEVRIRGMLTQEEPYVIYGVLLDENNNIIYGPEPMEITVDPIPDKPSIEVIGGRKIDD